jgi:hypothetical protein
MQPTSISRTGDGNRTMLVIVQNPGVSDPAFIDNFGKEPIPNGAFKMPANFNPQTSWPDPSSSSITEHEGQQLRLRTTGEITTTQAESGLNRKDNHTISEYCHWEPKCHKDVEEVAVDVKGLQKTYTFLPFENPCCDSRLLHSRSNSSKSLQAGSVHYPSNTKWSTPSQFCGKELPACTIHSESPDWGSTFAHETTR